MFGKILIIGLFLSLTSKNTIIPESAIKLHSKIVKKNKKFDRFTSARVLF
ncbi:MAG: hypothetical protein RLZZ236_1412 [Bacteroidota bacterium]